MRVEEVVESRAWINSETGATASVYGAVPWTSEAEKPQWSVQIRGFTWRMPNGTIGMGRKPVATREEAQAIMDTINARSVRS